MSPKRMTVEEYIQNGGETSDDVLLVNGGPGSGPQPGGGSGSADVQKASKEVASRIDRHLEKQNKGQKLSATESADLNELKEVQKELRGSEGAGVAEEFFRSRPALDSQDAKKKSYASKK